MAGGALPAGSGATESATDGVEAWNRYLALDPKSQPEAREAALRQLLKERIPDPLRRIIQQEIRLDPAFRSREAEFIRRYGFYANWFNRFAYTSSRVLQGNIQAVGQLGVDAVYDIFSPATATSAERRALRLTQELDAQPHGAKGSDAKETAKLEAKLNDTLADLDVQRARSAMKRGEPELAAFYAKQALARRPEWGKATGVVEESEKESAHRVREGVASRQAGYPDRTPPFEAPKAESVRALMTGVASKDFTGGDAVLAEIVQTGGVWDRDMTTAQGKWAAALKSQPDGPSTRWLRRMISDPRFNARVRLARAESDRRASITRFIFLGARGGERDQAYAAGSRFAQTMDAVSSIGLFYVFEVAWRAGVAAFKPPAPEEEARDAEGAYIRASRYDPRRGEIARRLAASHAAQGRYARAREILADQNALDSGAAAKLDTQEARHLLDQAESLEPGSDRRDEMLEKAQKLGKGGKVAKTAAKMEKEKPRGQPVKVEVQWESLPSWFNKGLPADFAPEAVYIDGKPENGERSESSFWIEAEGTDPDSVKFRYKIKRDGAEQEVTRDVPMNGVTPEVGRWITGNLAEAARLDRDLRKLSAGKFPFEVNGGAGLSGVDFYPKLLPLDPAPEEMQLYKDAP